MALGIRAVKFLDRGGRLRVCGSYCVTALWVALAVGAGAGGAVFVDRMSDWPYPQPLRRLVGLNTTSDLGLAEVPRGVHNALRMQRLTHYDPAELNCERWYSRRVVSKTPDASNAYRVKRFETHYDSILPGDLTGRWQEWAATLDEDFPCGGAYLVEDVMAKCNAWHRYVWPLVKKPIYTNMLVVGPGCP